MPEEVINEYWDAWVFWRATGRRVDFDHATTRFPINVWNVIFLLDSLYDKMTSQQSTKGKESDV